MGIINKPNNFSSNTTISSSNVNDDFDTIYNEFNGNIAAANLASNAVTTAKIADSNVTTAKIADSNVTTAKIADSAVTTAKINDANITPVKWTNPYKFSAYRTAALTSNNTATLVQFDTELFDSNNNFDVTTNKGRYTAPVAGFYFFNAVVGNTVAGPTSISSFLYKNGVTQIKVGNGATATAMFSGVSGLVQLAANDYVEIWFVGGAGSTIGVGSNNCYFEGFLVSQT